jgi:mono/diheme cytochrome c family protein
MPMTFDTKRFLIMTTLVIAVGFATAMPAAGQDAVKKGQTVYTAQKCQVCHLIAGKGSKANPLDGVGGKLSADEIKQWITHPVEAAAKAKSTKKPPMPAKYGTLPAADIDALVAYMQSLK